MDSDTIINEAFERHYKTLFNYCRASLDGDEQAAMDAVDNVFIIAKSKSDTIETIKDNSNEPIEEEDAITTDFDSLEALVAYMDGKALLLAEIDELQFVSARVTKDEEMTILHTKYLLDGDSIVIDMISSESPDYDALFHSQTDYSNYDTR